MRRTLIVMLLIAVMICLSRSTPAQTSGTLKWSIHNDRGFGLSSPALGPDGTIYIGCPEGVYALNPDKTVKWFNTNVWTGISSPAVGRDGTVYIGVHDDTPYLKLCALDPQNGAAKWSYSMGVMTPSALYLGPPAIGPDGTIYVTYNQRLYALNPNGSFKWSYAPEGTPAPDQYPCSMAIGVDGTIYCYLNYLNASASLFAIKPDGSLKWKFPGITGSPALGPDDTIYLPAGNMVYAVSPTGSLKWHYELAPLLLNEPFVAPIVGPGGDVYVRCTSLLTYYDTVVTAFTPGLIWKWAFPLGCNKPPYPASNTMAVGADGLIYVGSACGKLHALRPTGTEEWALPLTTDYLQACAPVISPDGTLYIASCSLSANGSDLFAVQTSSKGLANSAWPMLHRDARHTGFAGVLRQLTHTFFYFLLD
jgi:outer membrane protein assembly factor BamB